MSPSKLCPRHRAQVEATARIWPHLTKKDLRRRAALIHMQCRACRHMEPAVLPYTSRQPEEGQ